MAHYYADRKSAGKTLARDLRTYRDRLDSLVLAMPRGGVPVAYEIAQALHLPLDLMLVRKLGVPGYEELAMGAIAMNDVLVFNREITESFALAPRDIERVISAERQELMRRNLLYRLGRPLPLLRDRVVILVDDGMATGANMRAAVEAVRQCHPARVVVAVPVASDSAYKELGELADDVVCPCVPPHFSSLGQFYGDFSQLEDIEVIRLLQKASRPEGDEDDAPLPAMAGGGRA